MNAIKHIEFWVYNLKKSMDFYDAFFAILGWTKVSQNAFRAKDGTKVYFKEHFDALLSKSIGPRHICFQADSRQTVDSVGIYLRFRDMSIIRGPLEMKEAEYSSGYYTVDFYDLNGYILEVAFGPRIIEP